MNKMLFFVDSTMYDRRVKKTAALYQEIFARLILSFQSAILQTL